MGFKSYRMLSFLLVLLVLTVPALQRDWQGTGSMNETVMGVIHSNINNNPILDGNTTAQREAIAQGISTTLNNLYDPAWNVVIYISIQPYDTILYAYAFNNQWMWINGISMPSSSNIVSYLIWKDYSCSVWTSVDALNRTTTATQAQKTHVRNYPFTKIQTDVWAEAFDFHQYIMSNNEFQGKGYAIVASQYSYGDFYGYICVVNKNHFGKAITTSPNGGVIFMFQTRQQP